MHDIAFTLSILSYNAMSRCHYLFSLQDPYHHVKFKGREPYIYIPIYLYIYISIYLYIYISTYISEYVACELVSLVLKRNIYIYLYIPYTVSFAVLRLPTRYITGYILLESFLSCPNPKNRHFVYFHIFYIYINCCCL